MSRFFAGGSSDSDSSSASDDDYSDSDVSSRSDDQSDSNSDASDSDSDSDASSRESDDSDAPRKNKNKFLLGGASDDSDDDSDDGKRVVKSAKDKRYEEIESCVHSIENAQKINDWVTISSGMSWMKYLVNADMQNSTSSTSLQRRPRRLISCPRFTSPRFRVWKKSPMKQSRLRRRKR